MVNLRIQKRLAASVLKCGKRKVWLDPNETTEISMANSRQNIRKVCVCRWRRGGWGLWVGRRQKHAGGGGGRKNGWVTRRGMAVLSHGRLGRVGMGGRRRRGGRGGACACVPCLHSSTPLLLPSQQQLINERLSHPPTHPHTHPPQQKQLKKDGFILKKPQVVHSRSRFLTRLEAKRKGRHTGTFVLD